MSVDEIRESGTAEMDEGEVREFLAERGVGVLALSDDDDVPYVVPMSFGYDGEDHLYFAFLLFGAESRKQTLAERAGRGRFLVYAAESIHEWRSASVTGEIEAVPREDWDELQSAMENAWHPSLFSSASPARGVEGYRLRIEDWTAIRHGR